MAILRNILILTAFLILGCTNSQPKTEKVAYQANGLISISRQAPEVTSIQAPQTLAFMPIQFDSYWLKIDSKLSTVSLMQGTKEIKALDFISSNQLDAGSYKILIKDNQPLWYADEQYYVDRQLPIPLAFSSERYLKGVYGDKALFLENGQALFSNPEVQTLASGINVSKEILDVIYDNIAVESLVVVK